MKLTALIVSVCVVALLAVACGGEGEGGSDAVVVELGEQQSSGQSGTATLTPVGDGETEVAVELSNPPADPQPAHVHPGSCDELDPMPAYGLQNLQGGKSVTTVEASLEALRDGRFAINVHKSAADLQTYVACGDID